MENKTKLPRIFLKNIKSVKDLNNPPVLKIHFKNTLPKSGRNSPAISSGVYITETRQDYIPYKSALNSRKNSKEDLCISKSKFQDYLNTDSSKFFTKLRIPDYSKQESDTTKNSFHEIIMKKKRPKSTINFLKIHKNSVQEIKNTHELSNLLEKRNVAKPHCYVNYKKQLGRVKIKKSYVDEDIEFGWYGTKFQRQKLIKYRPMPINRDCFEYYKKILKFSIAKMRTNLKYAKLNIGNNIDKNDEPIVQYLE